jgi:excisionase family DNA binding protein
MRRQPSSPTVPDLVARRELWPMKDAAYRLGVTSRTLYRWIQAGELKAVKVGGRRFVTNKELTRYADALEEAVP